MKDEKYTSLLGREVEKRCRERHQQPSPVRAQIKARLAEILEAKELTTWDLIAEILMWGGVRWANGNGLMGKQVSNIVACLTRTKIEEERIIKRVEPPPQGMEGRSSERVPVGISPEEAKAIFAEIEKIKKERGRSVSRFARTESCSYVTINRQRSVKMQKKISVWVMSSMNAVGKTVLSLAMTDIMELAGRRPRLIEVNSLKGLSRFMGRENVLSFESGPSLTEILKDGNAILKHYDPIMVELEKGDSLLDLGASAEANFFEYCKLSRVDEDLGDMGTQVIVLIPTVAETYSINCALRSIEAVRSIIPSAKLVLVLNERDGGDFDRYFNTTTLSDLRATGVMTMVMPRIMPEGWADFHRIRSRFVEILSMEPAQLMEVHGYSRLRAKRAHSDIVFWFNKMVEGASFVLNAGE